MNIIKVTIFILMATLTSVSYASKIESVSVIDQNTLNVKFDKELLEDTSMFEFLITKTSDDTRELPVVKVTLLSSNLLKMTMKDKLEENTSYKIVPVFVGFKDLNIIEKWIDSIREFVTPPSFSNTTPLDTTSKPVITENKEINKNINEISQNEPVKSISDNIIKTDITINNNDKEKQITFNSNLPSTWPVENSIILILLSIWILFYIRKNKISI